MRLRATYYAAHWTAGPATVRIETRNPFSVADEALVHLSLSPPLEHDPDVYDVAVWDGKIAPALADLRDALHTVQLEHRERQRVLEVEGAAHLSAALMLGYAFREPTRWSLLVHHHDDVWETKHEPANLDGWDVPPSRVGSGREGDLVVMCMPPPTSAKRHARRRAVSLGPSFTSRHPRARTSFR